MYTLFKQRLAFQARKENASLLKQTQIGLEKESLRVNQKGSLSQTKHPQSLGSALTHPFITTDYSEAMLELITPPLNKIDEVIDDLFQTHCFVYRNLEQEILWATSMPCILSGSTSIPLAKYGSSNQGKMKTIYREGLGLRYGREMQVISGVHFNFSLSDDFWNKFHQQEVEKDRYFLAGSLQDFISQHYFNLIRNLQRYGWLIPYLFGASPAVCKSFIATPHETLDSFDESTFYEPYATSLRMGDIGYQNNKENESGIKACYNNIDTYVASLTGAINTPYPPYEKLGIKKQTTKKDSKTAEEYQQLNGNILQIENEYYSTVRPKQLLNKNEKPSIALKQRGVKYVELRSIDVNAFDPVGINASQLHFLEAFLIFCLLNESPLINDKEQIEIDDNEMITAHRGREPGLLLKRGGEEIKLSDWANELCEKIQEVSNILDANYINENRYNKAVQEQLQKIANPNLTPSAVMLSEMKENNESFHQFAYRKSKLNQHYFMQQNLTNTQQQQFKDKAKASIEKQQQIENDDDQNFDDFLNNYFNQRHNS